jgi:hypothetical protein
MKGARAMPALDAIASEVREWFGDYLDTFIGLAAGERTDLESVLDFYGVPLLMVADDRYLALPDRDAVLATAKALTHQLSQANYASSTIHRLDVRPLNARAALIEAVVSRHDREGNEFERLGVTYLAAKTDQGWRIASLVVTAP